MSDTQKFILVFLGSGAAMFLIFYLYPAEIFDAKIVGLDGGEVEASLSLKAFLFNGKLPDSINVENVTAIKRSLSGWMVFFVCVIGLPLMFAYRSIITKNPKSTEE
ncbi:MAG: hypothetical protein R2780_05240 [Crocinitomicaceae bacterium]|nr:hypothetical protein [Crocinitomicaceae bacterium]